MSVSESLPQPDVETLVRRVVEIITNAKSVPLSASVLISKDEVVELLETAVERLPDEMRQARWMLKEREEFLVKTRREGEEILDAARVRAERMVQRTEVVRQANQTGAHTVETAQEDARRLRHQAEDYCDQKLAAFEIVLERTTKQVQAGREKLRLTPEPAGGSSLLADTGLEGSMGPLTGEVLLGSGADDAFFDQDR